MDKKAEIYTNKFSLQAIEDDKRMVELVKPKLYSDDVRINRIITLGGDGTILFAIKMFYNKKMPPIISFGLGSVGYLWWFDSANLKEVLEKVLLKEEVSSPSIGGSTTDNSEVSFEEEERGKLTQKS